MKLYLKGNYGDKIPYNYLEFANKMWFKERNGIPLDFSHSWDEDIDLSFRLDKWGTNDKRWDSVSLKATNPWDSLKYESISFEVATAIDGQISEDDKETWLTVEEFKARHQEILSLTYEQATDISLEEIQMMKATYEPLQAELDRRREEYIKLHGEAYYEDDEFEAEVCQT